MMMRQLVPILLAALICVAFAPMSYASGVADSTELSKLISQSGDTNMTPNDLAFFLATHNYDATPKNGYVQVKISGTIYKVVPNGSQPGIGRPVNHQLASTNLPPGPLESHRRSLHFSQTVQATLLPHLHSEGRVGLVRTWHSSTRLGYL